MLHFTQSPSDMAQISIILASHSSFYVWFFRGNELASWRVRQPPSLPFAHSMITRTPMLRRSKFHSLVFLAAATLAALGLRQASAFEYNGEGKTLVNKRLKGSYGFAAQGYFGADFDAATRLTTGAIAIRVGVFKFDGDGHCSIHSMANKAGLQAAVTQDTSECTYEVYLDGTGKVDAVLGGKSFQTFFVLVNNGKEFMFTRREGTGTPADQGGATLVFAIAKKQ
ncbi:hypothetical protein MCA1733 [Methylococcus capsulatus str. Bath]|uniref:Uncharacterized protein n=3 Tax=Methylococcus capsulatus TaxID=414 RepID=Q607M6_METCA|nr:hypothetical protein MCA1733 [Methylococcus capsulatus str. Bath]